MNHNTISISTFIFIIAMDPSRGFARGHASKRSRHKDRSQQAHERYVVVV